MGASAFSCCDLLVSLSLSGCASLQNIASYAFLNCHHLTFLDLSGCSTLQEIGKFTFSSCERLVCVNLSECSSLRKLDADAFSYCTKLQTVLLPASVVTIGQGVFYNDTSLQTIYWMGSQQPSNIGSSAFPSTTRHIYGYTPA